MKPNKKISLDSLGHRAKLTLQKNLRIIRSAFRTESQETAAMLKTYLEYTQGEVGTKEMKEANKQFRNLLKAIGLGALAVLPFSPITIPLIVKLGEKLGVDVLPPSIREELENSFKN